jgi:hypothetical protein
MDEQATQAAALAAIAAGANAPGVSSNGSGPAGTPPQSAAGQHGVAADQPVPGDQTVLEARVAQLEDELANSRRINRVLTIAVLASFVLLAIATRAPDAIPGRAIHSVEVPTL